jgi:hypothetical protein
MELQDAAGFVNMLNDVNKSCVDFAMRLRLMTTLVESMYTSGGQMLISGCVESNSSVSQQLLIKC